MFTNPSFWALFGVIFIACFLLTFLIADTWKGRIITIIICIIAAFIFAMLIYSTAKNDNDKWNNGTHIDCGGTYQLTTATDYHRRKTFYYTCDKCGHTEAFNSIMR